MFKKKKLEDNKEILRRTLKKLEMERDLIIDRGRQDLAILPSDFFYFAVGALCDIFPDMKKNKEIVGYYNRCKKFTELYISVFPESEGGVTEEEYDVRLNNFKVALVTITKEINTIKQKLEELES